MKITLTPELFEQALADVRAGAQISCHCVVAKALAHASPGRWEISLEQSFDADSAAYYALYALGVDEEEYVRLSDGASEWARLFDLAAMDGSAEVRPPQEAVTVEAFAE